MNSLLKKFFLPVLLSIFLVSLSVIVYGEEQQTSKPITLKVFLAPFLSFGPYFIAEEEGFFVEQGIRVEFLKVSEAMALQAIAQGEIDVWAGIYTAGYLNAIRRGADIRVVADKGHLSLIIGSSSLTEVFYRRFRQRQLAWQSAQYQQLCCSFPDHGTLRSSIRL
jgi:hypothetical protein